MKHLTSFIQKKTTINCDDELISLSQPIVMGIVNITPDSFYLGSRYQNEETIINRVRQIINDGGKIVDIGAYSSRPNAKDISIDEEIERLNLALSTIKKYFPNVILSIDTFRAKVVEHIFNEFGSFIVNDISAGELDSNMFKTVASHNLPYIAMHMKGTPQTMVHENQYNDLVQDIITYFVDKVKRLQDLGVKDIILDPGYGFSKNMDQNYELLKRLNELNIFELPLLVGISRKRMIYGLLGITANEALNGTTVLNTIALQNGADILRVHDVKEAVECIKIVQKIKTI